MTYAPSTAIASRKFLARNANEAIWMWAAVGVLLVAGIPLMLCMPLAADAVLYDLQAQTVLDGGVLYRDIVEPNLPGIVWCHLAIRSLLGWSAVALRTADLLIVAGILTLLAVFIRRSAVDDRRSWRRDAALPILVLFATSFYFSTPEWVHCQRDIWLMLPALAAFLLRSRRIEQPLGNWRRAASRSLLEGALWGIAFWIKPFVAVPALAVIGLFVVFARRQRKRTWEELALDVAGVMAGGAIVGALGSAWLILSGAWPHFWDMALEWNPSYFAHGRNRWTLAQYWSLSADLYPWCLVHLLAIPTALIALWRTGLGDWGHASRHPRLTHFEIARFHNQGALPARALLSALYLGWLLQAHFLQQPFHYAHVPGIFLGMALLAMSWPRAFRARHTARFALAGAFLLAVIQSPAYDPERLSWWGRCVTEGGTPEVKCALHHRNLPNWIELQPVIDYLKTQNLKDGELTAYNVFLVHLYPELNVRPSTRYVFFDVLLQVFRDKTPLIRDALEHSHERFIVCSLLENGLSAEEIAADAGDIQPMLPAAFPSSHLDEFPYSMPLVFRSGQYVVYRAEGPVGELNSQPRPLAENAFGASKSPAREARSNELAGEAH
jgi:hypothetical protein